MHTLERLILSPRIAADVAARLRTAQIKSPAPPRRDAQNPCTEVRRIEGGLTIVFLPPVLSGEQTHSPPSQIRL